MTPLLHYKTGLSADTGGSYPSVSEIKGASCTRRAHFRRRVHDFRNYLLLLHNGRVHGENSGRTVLGGVHPVGAQNKTLISDAGPYMPLY